jgi:hypothetical protein
MVGQSMRFRKIQVTNVAYFIQLSVLVYVQRAICHNWGRRGMHIGYWWESQKVRDHWEDLDVGGWTILKWILER